MSKTLQGHCTKLNKNKKNKKDRTPAVSSRVQTTAILLYCAVLYNQQSQLPNHCQTTDQKSTVFSSWCNSQRRCIPDRQWQTVPRTCRSHWEGTVAEHWMSGGRYRQHAYGYQVLILYISLRLYIENTSMHASRTLFNKDNLTAWHFLHLYCAHIVNVEKYGGNLRDLKHTTTYK